MRVVVLFLLTYPLAALIVNLGGILGLLRQRRVAFRFGEIAVKINPKYWNGYWLKAIAARDLGNFQEAITNYTLYLDYNKNNPTIYLRRGVCYLELKEYQLAIEDNSNALFFKPNWIDAYINRGLAALYLKQYNWAISDFNSAIGLNTRSANAYLNRGLTYYYLKQYEWALQDYNQALSLKPKLLEAYLDRGLLNRDLKNYQEAIEDYQHCLKLNSKHEITCNNLADIYIKLKDFQTALQFINHCLQINPENAYAHLNLSFVYLFQGQIEAAKVELKRSAELDYKLLEAKWLALWLELKAEPPGNEFIQKLSEIAKIDRLDPVGMACQGIAFGLQGNWETGLEELNRAGQFSNEIWPILFWKVIAFAYLRRDSEANAALKLAIEELPAALFIPLNWLKQDRPDFYQQYALPLLKSKGWL